MPRAKTLYKPTFGYLPVGLTATRLVNLCYGKPFDKDRILTFFRVIYNASRCKETNRVMPNSFVQIHSSHLDIIFSQEAARYKQFMFENELIEKGTDYSNQFHKSCEYRIHPSIIEDFNLFELSGPMYERVELTSTRAIKANVTLREFKYQQFLSLLPSPYSLISDALRTVTFETETPEALAIRKALRSNPRYKDPYIFDEQLAAIKAGEIEYFMLCRFGRRFHSHFSSLKKEFRTMLRFPGCDEPLADLDIVNSQPWLTSILSPEVIARFVPELCEEMEAIFEHHDITQPDYLSYAEDCAAGIIYDTWQAALANHLGSDWRSKMIEHDCIANPDSEELAKLMDPSTSDRDAAKNMFFRVIFCPSNSPNNAPLFNVFRAEWPTVAALFAAIKEKKFVANPSVKKGGYTNLAFLMQRIESSLMASFISSCVDHGINRIIPIYDGALVQREDLEIVKQLFFMTVDSAQIRQPQVK